VQKFDCVLYAVPGQCTDSKVQPPVVRSTTGDGNRAMWMPSPMKLFADTQQRKKLTAGEEISQTYLP